MDWYAAKDGKQLGPISEPRLLELFRSGELTSDSPVWREGLTEWQPLATALPGWVVEPPTASPAPAPKLEGPVLSPIATHGNGHVYRDPKVRAMIARISMLMGTASGALITLVELATLGRSPTSEASLIDLFVGLIGLSALIFLVLSVVFFCMWTHRVVANAHAFGGRFNEITPGWAVGWYFIPFANLVKPYQALKQAWQTSHDTTEVPKLLPTWWGLWITSNILGNISLRLTMNDMADAAVIADIITLAIDLPLLFCIWQIITRLTRQQIARSEA